MAAARLSQRLWRCQVRQLATVAPIGRWGLALAARAGVVVEHFTCDDTRAVWLALETADEHGLIADRLTTVRLCVRGLEAAGCWDPADERPFVSGSRWGLPAVAALFTSVRRDEAEAAVPRVAAELLAAHAAWQSLSRRVMKGVAS